MSDEQIRAGWLHIEIDKESDPDRCTVRLTTANDRCKVTVEWPNDITTDEGAELTAITGNLNTLMEAFVSGVENDDPIIAVNLQ